MPCNLSYRREMLFVYIYIGNILPGYWICKNYLPFVMYFFVAYNASPRAFMYAVLCINFLFNCQLNQVVPLNLTYTP